MFAKINRIEEQCYKTYCYICSNKKRKMELGQPLSAEALCNNARPEETRNALLCNLKLMKRALTKDQYRKYVALINVTRANQEDKVSNPLLDSYLAEK